MPKSPDRQQVFIKVELSTAILLELWGNVRGLSRHGMAERIIEDRVNNADNKAEIWQGVRARAAIARMTPNEWISAQIRDSMGLDLGDVNWEVLFM